MLEDAASSLSFKCPCFIFKTWIKGCGKKHLDILEQFSHDGTMDLHELILKEELTRVN